MEGSVRKRGQIGKAITLDGVSPRVLHKHQRIGKRVGPFGNGPSLRWRRDRLARKGRGKSHARKYRPSLSRGCCGMTLVYSIGTRQDYCHRSAVDVR